MKKFAVIFGVIFSSCGQVPEEEAHLSLFDSIVAEESTIDISMLDTSSIDSTSYKIEALLNNTESAHTKVKEIKAIKKENATLKKELVETKAQLEEVKASLSDSASEPYNKKKKSFIQKVISTIKKDTVQ